MNRHEFIDFLKSLNLQNVPKEPSKEDYEFLVKMGVVEAFAGLTEQEKKYAGSFIKACPNIYYVELIRRVYDIEIWKKVKNYGGDVKRINWEYHKYFFHQYVGPFFYINGEIKALTMDYTKGKFNEGFINHSTSHFDFFNQINTDPILDYGNFPRGRVIFNNNTSEFYIYLDKEFFDKKEVIENIKKIYNLTSSNVLLKKDEHYEHDIL